MFVTAMRQSITVIFLLIISFLLPQCKSGVDNALQDKASVEKLYTNAVNATNTDGSYKKNLAIADSIFRHIKQPNVWHKIFFYNFQCWVSRTYGRYDLSLKSADSAIAALEDFGISDITATDYSSILLEKGLTNIKAGNYQAAYKNFFDAKKAADIIKDTCIKQGHLDYYGLVLYQQKEYSLAKQAFMEELNYFLTCNKNNISFLYQKHHNILDNIGLCFTKLNQFDSAKYYYLQSINVLDKYKKVLDTSKSFSQSSYTSSMGVIYGNLAKVYAINNLDSAEMLYEKAIGYNKNSIFEAKDAQLCMYQLAAVQLKNKQIDKAYATLVGLKQSLDTLPNLQAKLGYQQTIIDYYIATKQYQLAFETNRSYEVLKDSVYQKEVGVNTTNINTELRDREQLLQIQLLQKDKSINSLYLWIIAIALVLAAIIAFVVYRNYYKSKKRNLQLIQLNNEITTQQKITETTLDQLAIANKQKDKILNVVAHDLRNPIGAITNFLKVIQIKYEHSEGEERILKSTHQAATHSLTLINELLEVNRIKEGELLLNKTNLVLNNLLQSVVEQLQHKANEKQQNLMISTTTQHIVLNADAEKLQRVISNLVDNAIKFSANNKTIEIVAWQDDKQLNLQIKDAGIGIPKDIIEQLFTASITIKRSGTNNEKSNGLGLSICKQIIEAHSGTIDVESKENIGTTFIIKMPTSI